MGSSRSEDCFEMPYAAELIKNIRGLICETGYSKGTVQALRGRSEDHPKVEASPLRGRSADRAKQTQIHRSLRRGRGGHQQMAAVDQKDNRNDQQHLRERSPQPECCEPAPTNEGQLHRNADAPQLDFNALRPGHSETTDETATGTNCAAGAEAPACHVLLS